MSKFVVHLLQPLETPARTVAVHAAPHLSVEADRLEQVLARGPGVVTQPTSRTEAQRVADVLAAAGASAQVVPAHTSNAQTSHAQTSHAYASTTNASRRRPARRLSLRGKLLLITLPPLLLFAGAAVLFRVWGGAGAHPHAGGVLGRASGAGRRGVGADDSGAG